MKEVVDDVRSKEEMFKYLVSVLLYTYMFIQGYFYYVLFFFSFRNIWCQLRIYYFKIENYSWLYFKNDLMV